MNRAQRLLTLAYKAHQRHEPEIAGRIVTLAFDEPEAANMFEKLNGTAPQSATSDVQKAEATLRAAEQTVQGSVFTAAGQDTLLSIAEKAHADGMPKVAQLLADLAR